RHHRTYITSILSSTPPPPRSTPFPYTTLFRSPATSVDVGPTPTSLPQSSRSGNTHKQQIWSYAMNEFQFHRATTLAQAVQSGAQSATAQMGADVRFVAGGTNLVDLMKLDVEAPKQVVDINGL